jgi:5-methylcytosine-specific restriction enzyme subunit McrC
MILFEHERLRVGETCGSETFTLSQFEAIARWKERTNHPGIELGHRSIKATQWVGVLQVGRLTLEILPKAEADRDVQSRTDLVKKWKGILLEMIGRLDGFDLRSSDKAALQLQDHTLLDVFFHAFLTRTETILREGLVKTYRQVATNRTAWRGRLLVSEDLKRNLVHRERVFTAAMEFDVHNPWNRILVAALRVLSRHTGSTSLRSRAGALLLPFEDWSFPGVRTEDFARLRYDRRTERYRTAMELARLILLECNPDLETGREDVFSLLFDMNVLWERWVAHEIRRQIGTQPWHLRTQSSRQFWKSETGSGKVVRPDLLLEPTSKEAGQLALFDGAVSVSEKTVLDTKWKVLKAAVPSDADLKQMFVYNELWEAGKSLLLYPKVHLTESVLGTFRTVEARGRSHCGLAFVPIQTSANRVIQQSEV